MSLWPAVAQANTLRPTVDTTRFQSTPSKLNASPSVAIVISDEYGQIIRWRRKRYLIHHVADKTSVISAVIHDMQHDLLTRHGALSPSHKFEMDDFHKAFVRPGIDKPGVPGIHFLNRLP